MCRSLSSLYILPFNGVIFHSSIFSRYVTSHIRAATKWNPSREDDVTNDKMTGKVRQFTSEFLRQDGVFLLRLIGHNTNSITVTEIISELWKNWCIDNDTNPTPDTEIPTSSGPQDPPEKTDPTAPDQDDNEALLPSKS